MHRDDPSVERLILRYWRQRKTIPVILAYLRALHHVVVGLTWLKRKLQSMGLKRRNVCETQLSLVQEAIKHELKTSNSLLGYRAMWRVLETKYGYKTNRSTVMMLLAVMDPEGSYKRKMRRLNRRIYSNKGPNWCWHIDGYDKLKPFGFPIHGCIDGFSRKIIWLELTSTNNDPEVVVTFYFNSLLKLKGCPSIIRSDHGTENTTIAFCQMALRHHHDDEHSGCNSFVFGSSMRNTRIESWWSRLRAFKTTWWIDLLKTLVEDRLYDPDITFHRHLAGYVFMPLLQKELNDFKDSWNQHRVRRNKHTVCPCGVPDDLYNLYDDYKKDADPELLAYCMDTHGYTAPAFYPAEFGDLANHLLSNFQITQDDITAINCRNIYCTLLFLLYCIL